jgi:hypothetical protein
LLPPVKAFDETEQIDHKRLDDPVMGSAGDGQAVAGWLARQRAAFNTDMGHTASSLVDGR